MRKKQSGAILIISLIILLSLTLFVLSGSQSVIIQEKMTSAVRDVHISLEGAESGVMDAEQYIETLTDADAVDSAFTSSGAGGLYSQGSAPTDLFADATWSDSDAVATTTLSDVEVLYFIEDLGYVSSSDDSSSVSITGYGEISDDSDVRVFKIVSRSMGNSENTERLIVGYYGKSL